ncbi:MAG: hypothetical protein FIB06_01030 [Betaproteobacteria bacterium]|nr:hypothetical protein [Betaproteobacteria bacterium]
MWLLRLLAVVLVVAVGACLLAYVLTGNRAYLAYCWRLFRFALILALAVFGMLIVERVAIIPV